MFQRLKKIKSGLIPSFLAMLLLLSGCAFKRLIYDRLDWLVMYQIDGYLDLSKEQKLSFKTAVGEAIHWLKKEKVPNAILILGKFEANAKSHRYDEGLNQSLTQEVDQIRKDLFSKFERPIVNLLASLNAEQIEYLKKKLKKSNEDLEDILKEKNTEKEYEDEVGKKQLESVVEWYGDLDKQQIKFFFQSIGLNRAQIQEKLLQRQRLQAYIVETLGSHNALKIKAMVQSFADSGSVWQDAAQLKVRAESDRRWENYLKVLSASLTAEQWLHLEGKLREMRLDLEHMIGRE